MTGSDDARSRPDVKLQFLADADENTGELM